MCTDNHHISHVQNVQAVFSCIFPLLKIDGTSWKQMMHHNVGEPLRKHITLVLLFITMQSKLKVGATLDPG